MPKYHKKECIAMVLAGGQGSRLYVLTQKVAKPAVPFGGKYRIIDFTLSNCTNSDIDTVGVLTQYQPHALNAYIGSGLPWDMDRLVGGIHVLPPYVKGNTGEWYKGTANAIYQNIGFIDQYSPEYVVVLSGDHIYKMDYSDMLDYHKKVDADVTIAVLEVEKEEASRFGIMSADAESRIYEFEEKPKNPKSLLASMGIYIFTWEKLKQYLIDDEADPKSKNDFGGNIIPNMLANDEKLYAYHFSGYWKDVGTINSLWDANMDMLSTNSTINLFDKDWKIYSRNPTSPPHFIGDSASIAHSVVTEGCEINGTVENSILFDNVTISEGAVVRYSVLMPGVVVESGAVVEYSILAEDVMVERNAHVGGDPMTTEPAKWGIAVVAEGVRIGEGARVLPQEMPAQDVPGIKEGDIK